MTLRTWLAGTTVGRWPVGTVIAAAILVAAAGGCRQKMAQQPYYRPYEPSEFFADGRSARPLERGVIHRAQYLETDPIATGLTREEWERAYRIQANPAVDLKNPAPIENREYAVGAPRFDPRDKDKPKIYVEEFPFEMTLADLRRGQERYTIYCAVCHGPLGNGQGKIWERGYLTPTSFHTQKVSPHEIDVRNPTDIPLGYSRGYALWGIKIPLRDAPVGYYFEVITRGYGGMPSYSAQIPPADRWRIIAYIRVLQYSQQMPKELLDNDLEQKLSSKTDNVGGKK